MSTPSDPLPPPPWAEPSAEPPAEPSEASGANAAPPPSGEGGEIQGAGADRIDSPGGSQPAVDDGAPVPEAAAADGASHVVVGPSYVFFGVVAAVSLVLDVASKAWAEIVLGRQTLVDPAIVLIEEHLSLTLAYNKGGAWGLLQSAGDNIRKPFFLLVSALAIAFIVSLYGRLAPGQRALKWGLPLVLGGALGNLSDRIVRSSVIDFIDYRGAWVQAMNELVARYLAPKWTITDHWPTFNVADISICIGVGLMAVDMLTSRRGAVEPAGAQAAVPLSEANAPLAPADAAPLAEGVEATSQDPTRARAVALARSEGEETPTVPLPDVMPRLAQDMARAAADPTPTAQLPDVMPRVAQDLARVGQIPGARAVEEPNRPVEETPTTELPSVAPQDPTDPPSSDGSSA